MRGMLIVILFVCSCAHSRSSTTKAWEIHGDEAAAHSFIIEAVLRNFKGIKPNDPGVLAFADALQNAKTKQTESSQYILEGFWRRSQSMTSANGLTPIENYIVQEFVTHTNYLSTLELPYPALSSIELGSEEVSHVSK